MKLGGLQDINTAMDTGVRGLPRTQDGTLDELAQLMREKARLTEQRGNWQRRIDRIDARVAKIDARVAKIAAMEKSLQQAVAEEDIAFPAYVAEETGHKKRLNEVLVRY